METSDEQHHQEPSIDYLEFIDTITIDDHDGKHTDKDNSNTQSGKQPVIINTIEEEENKYEEEENKYETDVNMNYNTHQDIELMLSIHNHIGINKNIQLVEAPTPMQNIRKQKEEYKYESNQIEPKISDDRNEMKSSQKRLSQYIDCQEGHNIANCMPMKRIIDLLNYWQHGIRMKSAHINIYEYLNINIENYDISSVMEDWHQIRTNHSNDDSLNEWINNNKVLYCNEETQC
eukprot:501588_1